MGLFEQVKTKDEFTYLIWEILSMCKSSPEELVLPNSVYEKFLEQNPKEMPVPLVFVHRNFEVSLVSTYQQQVMDHAERLQKINSSRDNR